MAHHVAPDGAIYADTAFLNHIRGIPGTSVEHMGFGEFYTQTPHGRVDFDRMRGKPFPGMSGRSHKVYDSGGGTKAAEWLIGEMEKRNNSERVASGSNTVHIFGWDHQKVEAAEKKAKAMGAKITDHGVDADAEGDDEDWFEAEFKDSDSLTKFLDTIPKGGAAASEIGIGIKAEDRKKLRLSALASRVAARKLALGWG